MEIIKIIDYETWLIDEIENVLHYPYKHIKMLDEYPLEVSKQVLKILIHNACLGQNLGPIEISRRKIKEIDRTWLKQYFVVVVSTCTNCSDEWEYRRLVELTVLIVPELKQEIFQLGMQSENEEVREVIEDFQNL